MDLVEVILVGCIAGFATSLGGVIAFILPVHKKIILKLTLGFAGGIMVGLSLFQLMPEGYFFADRLFPVGFGFAVGIIFMVIFSFFIGIEEDNDYKKVGLFICLAIALHNFPEGLAIGVGFAGNNSLGFLIAFAMLLHNIPEGLSMSVPLRKAGTNHVIILSLTMIAGLVTPIGTIIGWALGHISMDTLGWSMGLAAGAMIYVSFTKLFDYNEYWNNLGAFCGILLTFLIA